jgi:hypothetical protein
MSESPSEVDILDQVLIADAETHCYLLIVLTDHY